jgi:hypothetical protein
MLGQKPSKNYIFFFAPLLSVCLEQTRVDNQRVVVMAKWKNARLAGVYIQTFIVRVK